VLNPVELVRGAHRLEDDVKHRPDVSGPGANAKVDRLEIRWLSGIRQTLTNLHIDRRIVVREEASPASR
jgi:hypothetical protein